ncbi:hypothetical protein VCHENC02_0858B, partial [Vibrio harveyi]
IKLTSRHAFQSIKFSESLLVCGI